MQYRTRRFGAALAAALLAAAAVTVAVAADAPESPHLRVAQLTAGGKLRKPVDLANWVFVGTSLGMGYNPGSFNARRPGQFQVVLMEPQAYAHFISRGTYAPGTMFVLSFYDADSQLRSNNQQGFTQSELTNFEIHLLGSRTDPERHVFYMFGPRDAEGTPLPPGNGCVRCHQDHGAFEGTFAQFYPVLRPHLPKEALERASKVKDIR
jgi:hypothetical protein